MAYNTAFPEIEAYRVLRTRILHRTKGSGGTTIMAPSALSGEGKTVAAVSLALTFAKAFSQTALLVDADLKRQQVHQVMGFESEGMKSRYEDRYIFFDVPPALADADATKYYY